MPHMQGCLLLDLHVSGCNLIVLSINSGGSPPFQDCDLPFVHFVIRAEPGSFSVQGLEHSVCFCIRFVSCVTLLRDEHTSVARARAPGSQCYHNIL